ncbi:L-threonylcarbamoyladenylate synthase [Deinococcus sp. HMF7604]|uniref:L-threonylcarbamoyladenylate synthase n=1 Tax=Deinococcus betulae TaxID=2873312 RepID=UPI001CCD32B1|nr:L-threonylcarbamoyladenylate synthase [Deinococcus betulae]MBZ9752444.1 L-threonylcarbamoyladenylate synthase [Deinococcus betulae]
MTEPLPLPHALLRQAARAIAAGGVVAYPSETVWGLAAHPQQEAGIRRLYALKGRDAAKPVQVSCASAADGAALVQPSAEWHALNSCWPGPLTLVAPASADCPPLLAPEGRVGIRVPDHPVALAFLRLCGGALATTSCNLSGEPAALTEAQAQATGLGDLTLPDGGVPCLGLPSTVFLLPERRVLREGALPEATLWARLAEAASR